MKSQLKTIDPEEELDMETALLASFAAITAEDCRGWISHPGIYSNKII